MPDAPKKVLQFIEPEKVDVRHAEFSRDERRVLDTVNHRVAAGESLDAIMGFVFEQSMGICACDRIGLAFLEDNGQRVVSHWARALYEPLLLTKGYAEDLRGSSLAAVRKTGRLRIINDLEAYLKRKPGSASTALLVQEGVRSSMTCPLVVDGRKVGFLFRSSRMPAAYGEHQVLLHQAVAERLSQAVEKAYRLEQLEAANRAYTEMLGFVSHELRSPLGSIVMDARLLTEEYLGPLAPEQRDKIEGMVRKADYLLGLVREYLDLAQVEAGRIEIRPRDVDFVEDVLEPAIGIVRPALAENGAALERQVPDPPVIVSCDPNLMQIVMVNLLGNAAKYGEMNGKVRVRLERVDGGVRLSVWNSGPGFPESERPRLFRRFSRLQSPELLKRKGTGVGLYTTWRIVQLHGGKIRAESEEGRWAEFVVEIPQPVPAVLDAEGPGAPPASEPAKRL
ncbi:MAG: GAF domain-containing sensor histidine kinase [Candidatus Hydrogenedentes bacterium]|nr:GAF domain-containing sensor histidine kinase [Candidatus Hydrogenedentota bacterium]